MMFTRFFELAESKICSDIVRRHSILLIIISFVWVAACASRSSQDQSSETLVDAKYLLQADRDAFAELRKEIPDARKNENDEKAFLDQLMVDESRHPSEVQNQFTKAINKKRDLFNKDMNSVREKFNEQQKKARESFSAEQIRLRKDFSMQKSTSRERTDFFDGLEGKRKAFYSQQKDQRDQFEADFRDKRRNFDDYVGAKNSEFKQMYRDYERRNQERKRLQADTKKLREQVIKETEKVIDAEYEVIRKKQPIYLQIEER